MAKFTNELFAEAKAELQRFGGRKETDPSVLDVLSDYWMNGAGRSEQAARQEISDHTAWSAAFISFVVKKALTSSGSPAAFRFSARHSDYVGEAILNLLQNQPVPAFVGMPPTGPGAVQPEIGDIIGVTRELSVDDYADALDQARAGGGYFSHFDIVTGLGAGKLTCIGGNVSDSVGEKTITLNTGFLPVLPFKFNSSGQVISGPYICVIRHRHA